MADDHRPPVTEVPIGFLESLPKWLICVPLVAQWLWLGVRYRSFTLPSVADPAITCGGLVGERKSDYFETMGPLADRHTARHVSFRVDSPGCGDAALAAIRGAQLDLPLIVKPEIGWCGFGVRLLRDRAGLDAYLAAFPVGESVVFQEYVDLDGEAGVFYMRDPGAAHGSVVGIALRHFPRVTGDGVSTLAQLIAASPRAQRLLSDAMHRVDRPLDEVPAAGRVVRLSTVFSLRVGGLYRDGGHLITPELQGTFDAIARDMREFHYGRFDVRFGSESDLAAGRGFRIIEVNGGGSEAIDAWDPALDSREALGRLFHKQKRLFAIAAANRARGHQPVSLRELARLHFRQQALIDRYPPSN